MKLVLILLFTLLVQGCNEKEGQMLPNGNEIISALHELKAQKKFGEDLSQFYPGTPDEVTRIKAETIINNALTELINTSSAPIPEGEFWGILRSAANHLAGMDSEELERGLGYMEELMDIYGIESSGGRLNEWRYGFDPTISH
jgi:hypothetical protein